MSSRIVLVGGEVGSHNHAVVVGEARIQVGDCEDVSIVSRSKWIVVIRVLSMWVLLTGWLIVPALIALARITCHCGDDDALLCVVWDVKPGCKAKT